MAFTTDFGLRSGVDWRETIALTDPSVDLDALVPALDWTRAHPAATPEQVAEVLHARALQAYYATGDWSDLPLRPDQPPPDRIRYRPLTVVERAAIDSACRRVVPDGNGGARVERSDDERRVLAFQVGADLPGLPAVVKTDAGREVPKRRFHPRLGREALADEVMEGIAGLIGDGIFQIVGNLILRASEASAEDTFRRRRDGVASGGGVAGQPAAAPAAGPEVRDVPGGSAP